ncbi:hypothetical protein NDI54_21105 [Haloarcula sp. S1AR25-5A]|uniref:Uncharacterized protein n=1 Tax=Haloarcula terrestris TaxID=2950533 RepID=A0AAE4F113_9EURY|nr:hypothetical protein [Haloarcula terrestris]MDS0223830.1 hypothetical protein [Haloarcula terrestris]
MNGQPVLHSGDDAATAQAKIDASNGGPIRVSGHLTGINSTLRVPQGQMLTGWGTIGSNLNIVSGSVIEGSADPLVDLGKSSEIFGVSVKNNLDGGTKVLQREHTRISHADIYSKFVGIDTEAEELYSAEPTVEYTHVVSDAGAADSVGVQNENDIIDGEYNFNIIHGFETGLIATAVNCQISLVHMYPSPSPVSSFDRGFTVDRQGRVINTVADNVGEYGGYVQPDTNGYDV